MKKTLLLLLVMLLATTTFAKQRSITPAAGEIWWGYFTDADVNADNYSAMGLDEQANYEAGIFIPKNSPSLGAATIKAVRLWFNGTTIPKITKLTFWINTSLKANMSGALYTQEIDPSTLTAGANDIELSTPFSIDNQKLVVGFMIELSAPDHPIMHGGEWETYSFYYRTTKSGQSNWQTLSSQGKLALQLLLEGAQMPSNYAIAEDFGTHYFQKGDEAILPIKIKNKGQNPISSISYTITTNGDPSTATPEVTVPVNNISYNASEILNISFDTSEAIDCTKTFTITKVNGVANEAPVAEASADGHLIIKAFLFTRVPVVEEFTGTWCGWCPRGFVAMETARETYGDKVVLIAAHNGDPMEISDYNPMMNQVSGFPSSKINRTTSPDPHPTNILNGINNCINDAPDGKVDITAQWNDEAMTKIDVETSTMFALGKDNANYGVALVVTEDGMHGTGSSWRQSNYYSGQSGDSYMTWWYSQGSYVSGLTYNFVAVAAWELLNGFNGSVNSSFDAGEEMKFNYLADISAKTLIQDKSNLKVIALLIDRSNKHIINAGQTTIKPYGAAPEVPGDVDGDGFLTAGDVTALYNWLLNDDNTALVNGDVDGDGAITAGDVTVVYNLLLGVAPSENVYVLGEVNGNPWGAATGVQMNTTDGKVFTVQVTTTGTGGYSTSYFALTKALASADDKWEEIEDKRFGPTTPDEYHNFVISDDILGQEIPLVTTNWRAFEAPTGEVYNLTVNLEHMTVVINKVNR